MFDSCDIFSLDSSLGFSDGFLLDPSLGSTDGFLLCNLLDIPLSFSVDEEVLLAAEVWSPDCSKLVLDAS